MKFLSKATAVVGLTFAMGAVSGTATPQSICKNTCDDHHVSCMNAGRSDDNVCLPQWRQCKIACLSAPAKPVATPISMATSKPVVTKR